MCPTFERKNIRLQPENYRGERKYFVTLCFEKRARYGIDPEIARWLIENLRRASCEKGFAVLAYCLMPDHLHVLAAGTSSTSDLLDFVSAFKQQTAFHVSQTSRRKLWQFKFYDHILRKTGAAEAVAWYIWLNPVRKGLCKRPEDYPYSGSLTAEGTKLFASYPRQDWVPPWKARIV
jgi:putative transposase